MKKHDASTSVNPLPAEQLRWRCDPDRFDFKTTAELRESGAFTGLVGQERAYDAISFGVGIKRAGFNIYALGSAGLGKHAALEKVIRAQAIKEASPDDWAYVNNFDNPQKPRALSLPPGRAHQLGISMAMLIDDLKAAIPAVFEGGDYSNRRSAIEEEIEERKEKEFTSIKDRAKAQNVAIIRTPTGFAMAPMKNGKVIKPEVFNALKKKKRQDIQDRIEKLQTGLEIFFQNVPRLEKEKRDQIRSLNDDLAKTVVDSSIDGLIKLFTDQGEVIEYLETVRTDLIRNFGLFLSQAQVPGEAALEGADEDAMFNRYKVNVIVSTGDKEGNQVTGGAPVIYEDHPTLANLVGRIEHISHMGALVTDFTLIKPGALHGANGGYLLVDAQKLLTQPFAWDALKRMLKSGHICIESPAEYLGFVSTRSLDPGFIPLDVKVVLIGSRTLYYLLSAYDPDFNTLFKVQADFDETADLNSNTINHYVNLIATIAGREKLKTLSPDGAACVVEQCVRRAGDTEKLSVHVEALSDLLCEADFRAQEQGADIVDAGHVESAVQAHIRRASRIEEHSREAITRNIMLIDTSGEVIGQVNGLSVISLGNHAFGRPSRITARVRMGTGNVVDIEREVELGGPLHSKGVLILSGYLAARYALDVPMSLWASLVFEQSYGGIDGDSASSAELYALLSALADTPINQCFAVTGSVNQHGQVQAIGGVNEKIEGFFDICKARGLDGSHGVLIPRANTAHLMLRSEIVDAAAQGNFSIYPIETIDEGIEILTGKSAGIRGKDGGFSPDTINGRVEDRLRAFAKMRKAFGNKPKHQEGTTES